MRQQIPTHRPWVDVVAYSRAVRVNNIIEVAGTTAVADDGTVIAPGDAYAQAKHALGVITDAITMAGGRVDDIVRTRVFLVDIDDWKAVGRAHKEVFEKICPACTFLTVPRLHVPELVVEIEATAILEQDPS